MKKPTNDFVHWQSPIASLLQSAENADVKIVKYTNGELVLTVKSNNWRVQLSQDIVQQILPYLEYYNRHGKLFEDLRGTNEE